jgi:hypothetical protein
MVDRLVNEMVFLTVTGATLTPTVRQDRHVLQTAFDYHRRQTVTHHEIAVAVFILDIVGKIRSKIHGII